MKALLFAVLITLLTGCTSTEVLEDPAGAELLNDLTHNVDPGNPERDLLFLSETAKAELEAAVGLEGSQTRRFRALRSFLFDEDGKNIQYDSIATFPASQTFTTGYGNCLSMSTLFVATARHVGLESQFKTVSVRPTWDQSGNTMIRYEHIVAVGDLSGGDDYVIDFLPEFSIGERSSELITDTQALALFHNNHGAEAVVNGEYEAAVQHLAKAVKLWPENSDSWNNLGAAYRRLEQHDLSEASFKRSLSLDKGNFSALSNLTQLYIATDRQKDAEQFLERVNRYNRRNPYFHFYLAGLHFEDGEYEHARDILKTAIRLKDDDASFYDALADTYRLLGELDSAAKQEDKAQRVREQRPFPRRRISERWLETVFERQ